MAYDLRLFVFNFCLIFYCTLCVGYVLFFGFAYFRGVDLLTLLLLL